MGFVKHELKGVYNGKNVGPLRCPRLPDRDRHCHGKVRNRVGYTAETKVYCRISMEH
jgi:hypothetical protein